MHDWDGRTYRCLVASTSVALTAAAAGVDATLDGPAGERADVVRRLRHLLDLDRDARPAEAHLRADAAIGDLVARRPGLRVPGDLDPGQTLLATVVGQQVSLAAARTVLSDLVRRYGSPPVGALQAGPDPARLAAVHPEELPMPRARGRSLVAVAAALVDGLDPATAGDATLLALPGVGPWTLGYLRLRSARDPDVFLASDLAARRQAERRGLPGTVERLATAARAWRPYRSTALVHLWTDYLETAGRDTRS